MFPVNKTSEAQKRATQAYRDKIEIKQGNSQRRVTLISTVI